MILIVAAMLFQTLMKEKKKKELEKLNKTF